VEAVPGVDLPGRRPSTRRSRGRAPERPEGGEDQERGDEGAPGIPTSTVTGARRGQGHGENVPRGRERIQWISRLTRLRFRPAADPILLDSPSPAPQSPAVVEGANFAASDAHRSLGLSRRTPIRHGPWSRPPRVAAREGAPATRISPSIDRDQCRRRLRIDAERDPGLDALLDVAAQPRHAFTAFLVDEDPVPVVGRPRNGAARIGSEDVDLGGELWPADDR
jgi:hypothetical protein